MKTFVATLTAGLILLVIAFGVIDHQKWSERLHIANSIYTAAARNPGTTLAEISGSLETMRVANSAIIAILDEKTFPLTVREKALREECVQALIHAWENDKAARESEITESDASKYIELKISARESYLNLLTNHGNLSAMEQARAVEVAAEIPALRVAQEKEKADKEAKRQSDELARRARLQQIKDQFAGLTSDPPPKVPDRSQYHTAARDCVINFLPIGATPTHSTLGEVDDEWTFSRPIGSTRLWEVGGVVQFGGGEKPARVGWRAYVLEHSSAPPEVLWQKVGTQAKGNLPLAQDIAGIAKK